MSRTGQPIWQAFVSGRESACLPTHDTVQITLHEKKLANGFCCDGIDLGESPPRDTLYCYHYTSPEGDDGGGCVRICCVRRARSFTLYFLSAWYCSALPPRCIFLHICLWPRRQWSCWQVLLQYLV